MYITPPTKKSSIQPILFNKYQFLGRGSIVEIINIETEDILHKKIPPI